MLFKITAYLLQHYDLVTLETISQKGGEYPAFECWDIE